MCSLLYVTLGWVGPFSPSGAVALLQSWWQPPALRNHWGNGSWEEPHFRAVGKKPGVDAEATQVPSPRTLQISQGAVVLNQEEEIRRLSHLVCSV